MENSPLARLHAYHNKWFPGQQATPHTLGESLFLEQDYWDSFSIAVANGINKAFGG